VIRIAVPPQWLRYIFAKGYIAINGASLTVAEVNRQEGWFEVWLIPETLRMTVFPGKKAGASLNIEIERATQVVVDTVRAMLQETLGPLLPALETLLQQQGKSVDELVSAGTIPK
jgi:riboflavin synthase